VRNDVRNGTARPKSVWTASVPTALPFSTPCTDADLRFLELDGADPQDRLKVKSPEQSGDGAGARDGMVNTVATHPPHKILPVSGAEQTGPTILVSVTISLTAACKE
jgi:hypothetical protein